MNKLQQIERLHQLFTTRRRRLSLTDLATDLAIEPEDCQRLLDQMKEQLASPIEFCSGSQTYAYPDQACGRYKLPKCWLNADEFFQVIALGQQLKQPPAGLLQEDLAPMGAALEAALRKRKISQHQFSRRIKTSDYQPQYRFYGVFGDLCAALLDRRQLTINYCDADRQSHTDNICPQLLLQRNHSWLLTYWCQRGRQLRCLDVARLDSVIVLADRAREIAPKNVEHFLGNQFGHNQKQPLTAHLCFSDESAFQVAKQSWHPEQQGEWQGDRYHLRLPLIDQDQLLGQVLAHLPNVQVLQPAPFAQRVTHLLQQALNLHSQPTVTDTPRANTHHTVLVANKADEPTLPEQSELPMQARA
ncbi:helix-turn-helix transcriptional regulator [Halioxenophilus aromaticivorans]|uniref:WYL domain-containing protein n=1 Tax=Halioxenophilus aromaticivorans TaxID=1306992 RepID=A0AAV3U5I4_9ALTE